MGEYILESLMGQERQRELTNKNIELFVELASFFYESGRTADELYSLLRRVEQSVGTRVD